MSAELDEYWRAFRDERNDAIDRIVARHPKASAAEIVDAIRAELPRKMRPLVEVDLEVSARAHVAKRSTTDHNIANVIADRVARRFPELARNPPSQVWFTGSNIWTLLYGSGTGAELEDWDLFALTDSAASELVTTMGWHLLPSLSTGDKQKGGHEPSVNTLHVPKLIERPEGNLYSDGYCYFTDHGQVDVWVALRGDVLDELRTYPAESHAHCRAAFSFTDGLIVLPNERAGLRSH